ncbi:SPASM domain-containing protein [Spirulina subsalsa]|uniref:SPASM domain-containing protein n=1 Tax=Spirulina subsalsa TaxID=54311 RepID=UPI0013DF3AB6|nr:SPASM domain-containing protein [Spirulina subsalsa]
MVEPPDKEVFGRMIVEALKYAENKPVYVLNAASTEYDMIRPVFCSNVGIPNWTVSINGDVIACARDNAPDEFVFGYFNKDTQTIVLDQKKVANLRRMNVLNYPECTDCFCKYQCAGDCPDRRIDDKSDCNSIREIGRYVLSQKLVVDPINFKEN